MRIARRGAHDMSERIPNFVYEAIYRAKSRYPSASAPRFNCFTPAKAYVADCWVCDAFGRIDPALSITRIINILQKGQWM